MESDAIGRTEAPVAELPASEEPADLSASLERTRQELAEIAEAAAQLRASLSDQVQSGVADALRSEVLPVARNLAEIRGLSNQQIERLDRVEDLIDDERQARIQDLDVLVELLASSWAGLDARLSRIEETLERLEEAPRRRRLVGRRRR